MESNGISDKNEKPAQQESKSSEEADPLTGSTKAPHVTCLGWKEDGSRCPCANHRAASWWERHGDSVLLGLALPIVVYGIWVAIKPLAADQDPFARLNLIVLCLLVASWLVGLCRRISVRAWATGLAFAGLMMWVITVLAGSNGKVQTLLDVFRY
jgi:hypothetical protein